MMDQSVDSTLPSVVACVQGQYQLPALILTIVFHPQVDRIGERAHFNRTGADDEWILGRHTPEFGRGSKRSALSPLNEPHISRRALRLKCSGDGLLVCRQPGSSRCKLAACELKKSLQLEADALRQGIPIMLGHGVVLLLRESSGSGDSGVAPPICEPALLGSSLYMHHLRRQIGQVATSGVDVLIRGETGTGKELVATALHRAGARPNASLVTVNMAAIPAALAPAALFGSARGAFTGADKASVGYFEQAQGGTLFLDEVGDTPLEVQAQLLRALQQREIQSVGGPVRRVELRVISATDAPLEDAACNFKAALRHRLGACEIRLLPLRQHPEDIGELLWAFIQQYAGELGCTIALQTHRPQETDVAAWAEVFQYFLAYAWPGNIRELSNFARQLVLAELARGGGPVSLPEVLVTAFACAAPVVVPIRSELPAMGELSEANFLRCFERSDYEVALTARELGVSRSAVYRRIQRSAGLGLASEVAVADIQAALSQHDGELAPAARQLRVSLVGMKARLRQLNLRWH